MIKVIIHGFVGKMGENLVKLIKENPHTELAAGIDPYCEKENYNFTTFKDVSACNIDADVVIDFSHYSLVSSLLDFCVDKKLPLVLCTTGLDETLEAKLNKVSTKIPIFKSGNMSLGINLLMDLVKKAANILWDFDVEIIEKHHNKKIDSPSGTAYMIASAIKESHPNDKEFNYGRYGNDTLRHENEIGIHAVRGGTIVGEHTAIFAGEDEIIEIKHSALSKNVFAQGALKAALYIKDKEPKLYNMDNLLK